MMLELQGLTIQDSKIFHNLTEAQQNALIRHENTAQQYFDYCKNDQIPEGTPYIDVEVYVNDDLVVQFEGDEVIGDVGEIQGEVEEISIWANGEVVWLQADHVLLLDHTRLNPLELKALNLIGGVA